MPFTDATAQYGIAFFIIAIAGGLGALWIKTCGAAKSGKNCNGDGKKVTEELMKLVEKTTEVIDKQTEALDNNTKAVQELGTFIQVVMAKQEAQISELLSRARKEI